MRPCLPVREDRKFEPLDQRGRVPEGSTSSVVSVGDIREPSSPLATKYVDPKKSGSGNPKRKYSTQLSLQEVKPCEGYEHLK